MPTEPADGAAAPGDADVKAEADAATDAKADAAETAVHVYADWNQVAAAVEAGELEGENFKPSGSGTQADPYAIGTPEAFAWWAVSKAGGAGTFARLDADIDLTSTAYTTASAREHASAGSSKAAEGEADSKEADPLPASDDPEVTETLWIPIASLAAQMDGQGHSVFFRTEGAGLADVVAESGAVRWLGLGRTDAQLSAAGAAAETCVATRGAHAGAVAGTNNGTIEGVVNRMPVTWEAGDGQAASALAGGIVGRNDGRIIDCANLGAVTNANASGDSAAAGIAAAGAGAVESSYSAGSVKAAANGAYLMTALTADVPYDDLVDDASCYLAAGNAAAYEGIALERDAALSPADLQNAAERLNAGREGDAAAWRSASDGESGATRGYPAPSKPANPNAAIPAAANAPVAAAATYTTWEQVGKAIHDGVLTDAGYKPTGSGTAQSPYLVETPQALAYLSYGVNSKRISADAHIRLESNIDLFGSEHTGISDTAGIESAMEWEPLGTGVLFEGVFDGNNCVVTGMRVDGSDIIENQNGAGLLGMVCGATIKNVMIGSNCKVTSTFCAGSVVGMVIGTEKVTVQGCSNAGTVEGGDIAGGIVGGTKKGVASVTGIIEDCVNTGSVSGSSAIGGIVGSPLFVDVVSCQNSGTVKGGTDTNERHSVGGIAGMSLSTVTHCVNTGSVSGTWRVGGIVGSQETTKTFEPSEPDVPFAVEDCYNRGEVTGAREVAGIVAFRRDNLLATGTVKNCYNAAKVSGTAPTVYAISATSSTVTVSNCFFDDDANFNSDKYTDKVGSADAPSTFNVVGKTTADMKTVAFADTLNAGRAAEATGWALKDGQNDGYPVNNMPGRPTWEQIGKSIHDGVLTDAGFKPEGDGTEASPYLVKTPEALAYLSYGVNNGLVANNAHIRLEADIDLFGTAHTGISDTAGIDNAMKWLPLGVAQVMDHTDQAFQGFFDGNNRIVKNMRVSSSSDGVGLLGTVCGATIKNVTIDSTCQVKGAVDVGAVVGRTFGMTSTTVQGCRNAATVEGEGTIGGIIGNAAGDVPAAVNKIEDCENTGAVSGSSSHGGIGGIAGTAYYADIASCQNSGTVTGAGDAIGGIVGEVASKLVQCANFGAVSGASYVGGIVGVQEKGRSFTIEDCYNRGEVTGTGAASGIVGFVPKTDDSTVDSAIANCYNAAKVTGSSAYAISYFDNTTSSQLTVSNCHFDNAASFNAGSYKDAAGSSGVPDTFSVEGASTANMQSPAFASRLNDGRADDAVWLQNANQNDGYPINNMAGLPTWEKIGRAVHEGTVTGADFTPAGTGTADDPYLAKTPEALAYLSYGVNSGRVSNSAHIRLEADIDLFGTAHTGISDSGSNIADALAWSPLGTSTSSTDTTHAFAGTFDGNGHTVKNMRVDGSAVTDGSRGVGLLGTVSGATVQNVVMDATCQVKAVRYAGAIVGMAIGTASTTVRGCRNAGSVEGTGNLGGIGGIAGNFSGTSSSIVNKIEDCENTGAVSCVSFGYNGGIVGIATYADIVSCRNSGAVKGRIGTGGVVGRDANSVSQCSNSGTVSGDSNIGGIMGIQMSNVPLSVTDCYNRGEVTATGTGYMSYASGIVGAPAGYNITAKLAIGNCYNAAKVSGVAVYAIASFKGQFADPADLTVANCFFDDASAFNSANYGDKAGAANVPSTFSVVGKTTADMQSSAFAATLNGSRTGNAAVWARKASQNDGYPHLGKAAAYASWAEVGAALDAGSLDGHAIPEGDTATGFTISEPEQLAWFAYKTNTGTDAERVPYLSASVTLSADLDMSGLAYTGYADEGVGTNHENCLEWTPISGGNDRIYEGTFDGAGHVLSDVRMVQANGYAGLFGFMDGTVRHLGLASGSLDTTGVSNSQGTIAAYSDGSISDCYSKVDLVGALDGSPDGVGALIGGHSDGGKIENCYFAGALKDSVSYCATFGINESTYTYSSKNVYVAAESGVSVDYEDAKLVPEAQLKTWAASWALNGQSLTGAWVTDDAGTVNGGFPVLATGGTQLRAAADWGEVGAGVDAGFVTNGGASYVPEVDAYGNYTITTPEALAWFAYKVNTGEELNAKGNITAPIDLVGTTYTGRSGTGADFSDCLEWTPIGGGVSGAPFSGELHGSNGNAVKNLYVNQPGVIRVGLVGFAGGGAIVDHVGVESGSVTGRGQVGGIVGGMDKTGDLVIDSCWNNAAVVQEGNPSASEMNAGGILGGATLASSGKAYISVCYNTGKITSSVASGACSGGIAGVVPSGSRVTECYNLGEVTGENFVAGILGSGVNKATTLMTCYNAGRISSAGTGGPLAATSATLQNCYDCSGFSGSQSAVDGAVMQVTPVQMKSWAAAYALNGKSMNLGDMTWTYDSAVHDGYPSFGKLDAPADWSDIGLGVDAGFIDGKPAVGSGTVGAPYELSSAEALAWFAYKVNTDGAYSTKSAKLTANIELDGTKYTGESKLLPNALKWIPIGKDMKSFYGGGAGSAVFDGNGKTVDYLRVEVLDVNFAGFVGVAQGCTLQGITVGENSSVTGHSSVGGVVGAGMASTTPVLVKNCVNRARIESLTTAAGGIAGGSQASPNWTIERCANYGAVSGQGPIGGILGFVYKGGKVDNCYNRGTVTVTGGDDYSSTVGGIAGYCKEVSNSYSAVALEKGSTIVGAALSSVATNCYYLGTGGVTDKQGTSVTEAQLKSWAVATGLNAGKTGTDRPWAMDDAGAPANDGYPVFATSANQLRAAADWSEVGAGVELGFISGKPTQAGTTADPYQVGSAEALAWFAYKVNTDREFGKKSVKLTADIDLDGVKYTGEGKILAKALKWIPIGKDATNWYGGEVGSGYTGAVFNGNGKTVDYMRVDGGSYVGLLGCTHNCTLQGVTIGKNSSVKGSGSQVGGVAGGYETWSDSNSSHAMLMQDCFNYAAVTGLIKTGGVIGNLPHNNKVANALVRCGNFGTVRTTGTGHVCSGGVVGQAGNSGVINCFNRGNLTLTGSSTYNGAISGQGGTVRDSYNAGAISNGHTISGTWSSGTYSNCYYLSSKVGSGVTAQGKALTETQLKSWAAAWALNGGKLDGAFAMDDATNPVNDGFPVLAASGAKLRAAVDWSEVAAGVELDLVAGKPTAGSGTTADPYQLSSAEALAWFAYKVNTDSDYCAKSAKLTGNIDLDGAKYTGASKSSANALKWMPIGENTSIPYGGGADGGVAGTVFDGNGKTVDYMRVVGDGTGAGFVGAAAGCTLQGITIGANSRVKGEDSVGGVVGKGVNSAPTLVTDCVNHATIEANSYEVGGIAGTLSAKLEASTIQRCANYGTVRGTRDAGGIVGHSGSKVENCYNRGAVEVTTTSGGIAGSCKAVSNSYNVGTVRADNPIVDTSVITATITDCYHLDDTADPAQGKALSETQLKSWAAAYALNNKEAGDGTTWAYQAGANDGYPSFGELGAASSWADIGLGVEAGLIGTKPTSVDGAYDIGSAEQLAWLAYMTNDSTIHGAVWGVKLTSNIDLTGAEYLAGATGVLPWSPIGSHPDVVYQDAFDGNGMVVKNLAVTAASSQGDAGLFGTTSGRVKRVGVELAPAGVVAATGKNAGGLAGTMSGGTVEDCYVLAGELGAGSGAVTGGIDGNAGGLVGEVPNGSSTSVRYCYAAVSVKGAGSLAPFANGAASVLRNCYYEKGRDSAAVPDNDLYGVVGRPASLLKSIVTASDLNGGRTMGEGATWLWDLAQNGGYPCFGTSLSVVETWADVGRSQDEADLRDTEVVDGEGGVSNLDPDVTYAVEGSGTTDSPLIISSPEALAWFANQVNSKGYIRGDVEILAVNAYVQLGADLNLSGLAYTGRTDSEVDVDKTLALKWEPIGSNADGKRFAGTMDGAGREIDYLYFSDVSRTGVGLIGWSEGATVKLLGIGEHSYVQGKEDVAAFVGGCLANRNNNVTIENCFNRATVVGGTYNAAFLGDDSGYAGSATNSGTIKNCYNVGDANFAFMDGGTLDNCFADTSAFAKAGSFKKKTGSGVKALNTAQMKSWAAAFALNGKKVGAGTAWAAGGGSANDGYPVFAGASGLRAAADWGEVGLGVDAGLIGMKPAESSGAYTVSDAEGLAWVAFATSASTPNTFNGKTVKLAGGIDLTGKDYTGTSDAGAGYADCLTWKPIGTSDKPFSGTLDGAGMQVTNLLTAAASPYQGLLGYMSGSKVQNLTVASGFVHGSSYVGGIVGAAVNDVQIQGCSTGAALSIDAVHYVGGILGEANGAAVERCVNRASVSSNNEAGGIVGAMYTNAGKTLVIKDCANHGDITSRGTGNADVSRAAGIYARVTLNLSNVKTTISGCYNTGNVTAASSGKAYGVSLQTGSSITIKNSAYDTGKAPAALGSDGVVGATTDQMKSWAAAYYLNGGGAMSAMNGAWAMDEGAGAVNGGYPVFANADSKLRDAKDWGEVGQGADAGFIGTVPVTDASGAYELGSEEALAWFAYKTNAADSKASFKTANANIVGRDLDLTGAKYSASSGTPLQWASIAKSGVHGEHLDSNYSGTFDGGGFTIKNLYQNAPGATAGSSWGLLAYVTGGTVKNVVLDNVSISATSDKYVTVGGVVGQITGGATVEQCAVLSGTLKGTSSTPMTGGIVGDAHDGGGTIKNCYSRASVGENAANKYGGGILGRALRENVVSIEHCYYAGTQASNPICYTSANGTSYVGVYYDSTLLPGSFARAGVTGMPTADLQSWAAVLGLNGGSRTGSWTLDDASAPKNGGYPVFGTAELRAAADWGEVGRAVSLGIVAGKPAQDGLTAANAAQIDSAEALAWFAYQANTAGKPLYGKLTTNIDLTGSSYTDADSAPLPWVPIGTRNVTDTGCYQGAFDGGGFEVDYLRVASGAGIGLFGAIDSPTSTATVVQNVGVGENSQVTGGNGVAGVVGYAAATTGDTLVSGCWNKATASGESQTGGIVGGVYKSAAGRVHVRKCFNEGAISTSKGYAGGIVGIVFQSSSGNPMGCAIENCYNRGTVAGKGSFTAAGIVAFANNTDTKNCYNAGSVTADGNRAYAIADIGTTSTSYYLAGSAANAGGGTSLTAAQLQSWSAAYALNGKKVGANTAWATDEGAANDGYPVFADASGLRAAKDWNEVGLGVDAGIIAEKPSGSDASGYAIAKPEHWAWLSWRANGGLGSADAAAARKASATISSALNLFGADYTGNAEGSANYADALAWTSMDYAGTFDGGQKRIENLNTNGGLFGLLSGTVKNVAVESGRVGNIGPDDALANSPYAGAIAKDVKETGKVLHCSSKANVNLTNSATGDAWIYVGGIAGFVRDGGAVGNCYSTGNVTASRTGTTKGDFEVGGLVGSGNKGTVKNSYYAGALSASGAKTDAIVVSHYNGGTPTVSDCFYDKTKNPSLAAASKGTGLDTAHMKSWNTAYKLNGQITDGTPGGSYVGSTDGTNPTSTTFTIAGADLINGGYPIFGNLEVNELTVELDPADVLDGTAAAPAKKATGDLADGSSKKTLTGDVYLLKAPTAPSSGAGDSATLTDAATVDGKFSTWGTDNASKNVALVAGATSLKTDSTASITSNVVGSNLSTVDLHAAAAYLHGAARTTSFVLMDDMAGYRVTATVKGVDSKKLDVTVPVEAASSFELSPDGKVHQGANAAAAKASSTLKNNTAVPLAGGIKSVSSLAKDTALPGGKKVAAVLQPGKGDATLAAGKQSVTDAGMVKLYVGSSTGADGLSKLDKDAYFAPSGSAASGTTGTVPLWFTVPGTAASGGTSVSWKWKLDYTGTYIGSDEDLFGFQFDYSFGLPKGDADAAALSGTKVETVTDDVTVTTTSGS